MTTPRESLIAALERRPLPGMVLCSDYCFNTGPFLSPLQFSEFIAPYLARQVQAFRDMGYYVIKHTDGNILPLERYELVWRIWQEEGVRRAQ